jgi:hypothetical protein
LTLKAITDFNDEFCALSLSEMFSNTEADVSSGASKTSSNLISTAVSAEKCRTQIGNNLLSLATVEGKATVL